VKIIRALTVVGVQTKQAEPRGWAASTGFLADKVVLQGGMYAEIFGEAMKSHAQGRPWKRGVVTIQVENIDGARRIRRVFAGSGALSVTQQEICLDAGACAELGVAWGEQHEFTLSGARTPFGRAFDRFLHYWNHPADAVRASFKLGLLGCGLAFKNEISSTLASLIP